jgi:hypothetical protein
MVAPEIKQTVSAGLTCSHYPVNGSIRFALEILTTIFVRNTEESDGCF